MTVDCTCLTPPFFHAHFDVTPVSVDESQGRFGEVRVETCRDCGRHWLRYFVEYEAFSKSGRWYRGVVSEEVARTVTPSSAVEILENLDWYFYGGSYFDTVGKKGSGRLTLDL